MSGGDGSHRSDRVEGWDALVSWGSGRVVQKLGGGPDRDVRLVELDGRLAVARLGGYGEDDLDWELDLLDYVRDVGVGAPAPIPAADGRRRVGQLVVVELVEAPPPSTTDDWRAVGSALRWLHRMTEGWPQRPGRVASTDLVHVDRGVDIDLRDLPGGVVEVCRSAWARLDGRPTAVVQGEPTTANVRMTPTGPVFLDWTSARVDVPDLDLAELPDAACPITGRRRWLAAQAASAWAAATSWENDREGAERRLDEIEWP